jgi:nitroreductase
MFTIENIKKRRSWRTFIDKPVEAEKRSAIETFMKTNTTGIFGSELRFAIIDINAAQAEEVKHLGTYGVIDGAKLFMAGAVKKTEYYLEDFGYAFEKLILLADSLGLGTCWMGVTFDRAGFGDKLNLKADEDLTAASPVGYAKEKRRLKDLAMRKMVGSDKRKDFSKLFFDGSFDKPFETKGSEPFFEALECVRLAPSASNQQPWRIVKDGENFHLYLEHTKGYQYQHGQRIDMGIAMLHFEIACKELGIKGEWVKGEKPAIEAGERVFVSTFKVEN